MARILVTGGAGFIGSHTADALSKNGFKIRILDNLEPLIHPNRRWPEYVKSKGFELIRGDVSVKSDLEKSLRGVDFVYHLAAYQDQRQNFSKFFSTNTQSAALLYEIIVSKKLSVKKIILASTQFVYGDGRYLCPHSRREFYPGLRTAGQFQRKDWLIKCPHGSPARIIPFKEDQKLTSPNSYSLSKEAAENLSLQLGKTYKIPTAILRYSIVQGPRQSPSNLYSGALRIFVSQSLAGVPITVYEDGEQTRDFINIGDVVVANLLVLKNKKTDYEVFNVGGGRSYKIINLAELVKKNSESQSKIILGSFRRTDTRHAVSDISKLKKLGWRPKLTLEHSVIDYIKWFKDCGFEKKLNKRELLKLKKGIK